MPGWTRYNTTRSDNSVFYRAQIRFQAQGAQRLIEMLDQQQQQYKLKPVRMQLEPVPEVGQMYLI